MSLTVYVLAGLVLIGLFYFGLRNVLKAWLKYRGTRVITCPENQNPAAVHVDARYAAMTAGMDQPVLRLDSCSRWPERAGCGQECLKQIQDAPEDCLVRNILGRWYAGKTCVYCEKALGEIEWAEHQPALRAPDGHTYEWSDIAPEALPAVLLTHQPVCWRCHVAMTFRREHPELVVDRDFARK